MQSHFEKEFQIICNNLDEEERNNNDTHDKEFQWSEEQLDILVSVKDSFSFQQRSTIDLVFKKLSALVAGDWEVLQQDGHPSLAGESQCMWV